MQEQPTINDLLNNFHQALQALAKRMSEIVSRIWKALSDITQTMETLLTEENRNYERQIFKFDLKPQRMKHQVIINKPRNMIRKIIH
ncbi:hypothetical protein [Paenisporosarcina sp. TG-14]|uniref:hypothetical protein n=1 Tax=Paenisporosarcina sp. TG-14 TaxID=1231057 RepID=UPI0002E6C7B5|nr:hypothetical protein [Paenisporosarcina sp. TG-14]